VNVDLNKLKLKNLKSFKNNQNLFFTFGIVLLLLFLVIIYLFPLKGLKQLGFFERRDKEKVSLAITTPNDPQFPSQWAPGKIRAPEAWDIAKGSSTIKVAQISSGIRCDLADLVGQCGPGYNAVTPGGSTNDDFGSYGMGTRIAGVIGAKTNNSTDIAGISWNITILPVKVCDLAMNCFLPDLAEGINWAVDQGVQIIDISLGYDPAKAIPEVNTAVANALSRGILVVASAGNYAGYLGYPASLPGVIAVGATDAADVVGSFSGRGPALDITAPGVSVLTLTMVGCCYGQSGAEVSAGHVSGALALLLAAGVPASQAENYLFQSAVDLGPAGRDDTYGYGRLDICGALNAAGKTCPVVTPAPTADIKANGSNGPITISYNTSATISWTSTNVSSCTVSPTGWTGTSGSQSSGNLTSSQTYTLSCSGPGGSASDSVVVNVSPPPTCTRANPAVTLTPTSQSGSAGGSLNYSLSVTNNDSLACSSPTFSLTSSIPVGWSASFSPTSLNLAPGASGSATLAVTSATGAAAGSYPINATATNSSDVSYKASASATYAVTAAATCNTGVPADKFHVCFFDTTDPTTGPFIGERDEGAVTSPAPVTATPVVHDYASGGEFGQVDTFSGVWRGNINFPAGVYKFKVVSDDGVRLDVGNNGSYEINQWIDQPPAAYETGPISLNGYTPLRLEWYENEVTSYISLGWTEATPPSVSITSPAPGALLKGTVNVAANATDNVGVTKVEFYVDGVRKVTDTISPYSFNWDTTVETNANHNLQAWAYDAANVGVSSNVAVTVDNQPPSAPTGLVATAPAYNQVNLTWNPSTDNVAVDRYWVVRIPNGSTIASTTATSYTDNTVSASTTYSYYIIASDTAGSNSAASNTVTVTTPAVPDTQAPTAPTNLTATAVSSSQINLSWTASTDNVRVTGYDIYYTNNTKVATVSEATTSFGDTGLSASTTYSYYVKAFDAAGNPSAASNTASETTFTPPAATGNITGTVYSSVGGVVVGAKVSTFVSGSKRTYYTNSSGVYSISSIPAASYSLTFSAQKYISQTVGVTVTAGVTVTKNVTLQKR